MNRCVYKATTNITDATNIPSSGTHESTCHLQSRDAIKSPLPLSKPRSYLILQRPKKSSTEQRAPRLTTLNSVAKTQQPSFCSFCQAHGQYKHVLSDVPLCAVDLSPPSAQVQAKVNLCRHRLVYTRDDLLARRFTCFQDFLSPPPRRPARLSETMSSDSTIASTSDFDVIPTSSSEECNATPRVVFLLERCSIVSTEIVTSSAASLSMTGNDVSLFKEYLISHNCEAPNGGISDSPNLRLQIASGFQVFVHRPISDSTQKSDEYQQMMEWRKHLRSSIPVVPEKRRLMRFICDHDEHVLVGEDAVDFKRFVADFLRPSTCVDVLVEIGASFVMGLAIRIRTGETPLWDKKWKRRHAEWKHKIPDSEVYGESIYGPNGLPMDSTAPLVECGWEVSEDDVDNVLLQHSPTDAPVSRVPTRQSSLVATDAYHSTRLNCGEVSQSPRIQTYDTSLSEESPPTTGTDFTCLTSTGTRRPKQGFTPSCITMVQSPPEPFDLGLKFGEIASPLREEHAAQAFFTLGSAATDYTLLEGPVMIASNHGEDAWPSVFARDFCPLLTNAPHSLPPVFFTPTWPTCLSPCPCFISDDPFCFFSEKKVSSVTFSKGSGTIDAPNILCCFWDFESTGLRVMSDQVIQIGCTARVFHTQSEASSAYFSLLPGLQEDQHDLSLYVRTDLEIPHEVSELTNITNHLLDRQGVELPVAFKLWHQWLEGLRCQLIRSTHESCEVWMIAHNGNQFDIPLLFQHEITRLRWSPGTLFKQMGVNAIVDSVILSRALFVAEQELDEQKSAAKALSRSHRLSDLYWNSFHESMPNQHNALCKTPVVIFHSILADDAKAVSMVMSQEPFLGAWRQNVIAWDLNEYIHAWYRARGISQVHADHARKEQSMELMINKLISDTASRLPVSMRKASPRIDSFKVPNTSSIAKWKSFRERAKMQAAQLGPFPR